MYRKAKPHEDAMLETIFGGAALIDLDGQNRQSPIASVQRTRSTLASHSAVPRGTKVTRTNANCAIRIAMQRTQGLRGQSTVFLGGDMTANER